MKLNEYQKICERTAKRDFETSNEEIMTWRLGIAGEAGDIAGCIKKTFAHKKNQEQGIRENLGDTLWYAAMICNFFKWNMDEILGENIDKLKQRFPNGFGYREVDRERIDWNK